MLKVKNLILNLHQAMTEIEDDKNEVGTLFKKFNLAICWVKDY